MKFRISERVGKEKVQKVSVVKSLLIGTYNEKEYESEHMHACV